MICGIGTDIVEIRRIREAVGRWGDHFLNRVFSQAEIAYCFSRSDPALHLAARFAVKEAAIKALGANVQKHYSMADIEVLNEPSGRPTINIRTEDRDNSDIKLHVSISHERSYALATVIAEKD